MEEHGRPEEHASGGSSQVQHSYQFITFNDLEGARTVEHRQQVRSQALRHFHRKSRSSGPRLRRNEFELDISPLLQRPAYHQEALAGRPAGKAKGPAQDEFIVAGISAAIQMDEVERTQQDIADWSSSPRTMLGVSRIDPFFRYPIELDPRTHELTDHLYDDTCIMFRTMRDIGFFNRTRGTAGFRQLLAISSWHMAHLLRSNALDEFLEYSVQATQELQNQINDPRQCYTDDAVGAVLVFAASSYLTQDIQSWNLHVAGLRRILEQRGGLQSLDADHILRFMLFLVDVNGSHFQDVTPHFPAPDHLLPTRSETIQQGPAPHEIGVRAIPRFCLAMREALQSIRAEMIEKDVYQDTMFPGMNLSPLLRELLALRPESGGNASMADHTLELFRLSAVLFVGALRAKFGLDTLPTVSLYTNKVLNLLSTSPDLEQHVPFKLFLWILAVAFTSQCPAHQKLWFRHLLIKCLASHDVNEFTSLIKVLSEIAWDEDILENESHALGLLLDTI